MSFDKLPPGVKPDDVAGEPEPEHCRHCDRAPCECERLEQEMDQRRMER